jgi:tripartite-type tricarboxylate transporter receptor subunit TctC
MMHGLHISEAKKAALLSRRRFLHLAAGGAALPAVYRVAWAQTYPSRPVRIIVPNVPGGSNDVYVRLIAQRLWERLGQPFIIENRPGAGSNIGTEAAVRSAADGYTLLSVGPGAVINATLYDKLNFNFIRDIVPVAAISRDQGVLVVHPSVPAQTIPEFIAYAKANPGKLNMASTGIGSLAHVSGELFKTMTGVTMTHVPYRGGPPAFTDLLSNQVQVMFSTISACIEHIKANKLRSLAVTTATRSEALPDLPTINDFVPHYEASTVYGIGAPRNTPAEIVDELNKEINAALADPKLKARIAGLGGAALALSPADYSKLIADETEKWGKVIRAANIRPN